MDGVCELDTGDKELKLTPVCAAIRHPDRGDFYGCGQAEEGGRRCVAEHMASENMTIERCWCDNVDFCNDDMLTPIDDEDEDEDKDAIEDEESQKSSSLIPFTSPFELTSESTSTTVEETTEATIGEFQTTMLSEAIDSRDDFAYGDDFKTVSEDESSGEKAQATFEGIIDDEKRQVFSEVIDKDSFKSSLSTESASTTAPMEEIPSTTMTKKVELTVSSSLRTDYLKPATLDTRGRSGAIAIECKDGDCSRNLRQGPASENGVSAFYTSQYIFYCWFLTCIFAIPAIFALKRA